MERTGSTHQLAHSRDHTRGVFSGFKNGHIPRESKERETRATADFLHTKQFRHPLSVVRPHISLPSISTCSLLPKLSNPWPKQPLSQRNYIYGARTKKINRTSYQKQKSFSRTSSVLSQSFFLYFILFSALFHLLTSIPPFFLFSLKKHRGIASSCGSTPFQCFSG